MRETRANEPIDQMVKCICGHIAGWHEDCVGECHNNCRCVEFKKANGRFTIPDAKLDKSSATQDEPKTTD